MAESKKVTIQESEQLQKEGWQVVEMVKENGVKVHVLIQPEKKAKVKNEKE